MTRVRSKVTLVSMQRELNMTGEREEGKSRSDNNIPGRLVGGAKVLLSPHVRANVVHGVGHAVLVSRSRHDVHGQVASCCPPGGRVEGGMERSG